MDKQIREISKKRKWKRILKRSVALLCAVVMLFTMNTLKRNADTLERIAMCGYAEHVHSASCFSGDVLVCGMEEHVHTDACYQESPASMDMDDLDIEVEASIVDDTVEELDLSLTLDNFDLVTEDVVAEPVSNEVEEKVYSLGTGAMVSHIIGAVGLGVSLSEIIEVAAVENDEAHSGLIAVEKVDGDYRVWAKRDFAEAELALIITDDIYVVKLTDGIAQREDATPEVQPAIEEAPSAQIDAADSAELPAIEDAPTVDAYARDDEHIEVPVIEDEDSVDGQDEDAVHVEDVSPEAEQQAGKVEQPEIEDVPGEQAGEIAQAEQPAGAQGEELAVEEATEEQPAEEATEEQGEELAVEEAAEERLAEEAAGAQGEELAVEEADEEQPAEEADEAQGDEQPAGEAGEEQGEEPAVGEAAEGLSLEEAGEEQGDEQPAGEAGEAQGEEPAVGEAAEGLSLEEADEAQGEEQPAGEAGEAQGEEPAVGEAAEGLSLEEADEAQGDGQPAEEAGEAQSEEQPTEEQHAEEAGEAQGEEQPAEEAGEAQGEELAVEEADEAQGEEQPAEEAGEAQGEEQPAEKADEAQGEEQPAEEVAEEQGEEQPAEEAAEDKDEEQPAEEAAEDKGEEEFDEETADEQGEEQPAEETAEEQGEEQSAEDQGEDKGEEQPAEEATEDKGEEEFDEETADEQGEEQPAEETAEEQGEEQSAEEQSEEQSAEEATEEQGEEQPAEAQPTDESEPTVYTATIDLTDVETYPLSLNAMLTAATPEQEEIEEEAIDGEAQEDQAEEQTTLTIDYDEALLEVVEQDGDYLVTPIQSFESTQIIVNNGSRYELTLVNCVLATDEKVEDEGEQQEEARDVPVYTATIDLTDATYPLSLNEMITAVTPEQDEYEEAQEDQAEEEPAEEQPEEQPTLTIDYDEALLEVVGQDGDYLVRPVQSFESTQIIVTNGSRYELTLLNCVLKAEEQEEQSVPVHTATIDLTNATYPLSLNELITGAEPEQDEEQAEAEQPGEQPEAEQTEEQSEEQSGKQAEEAPGEQPTLTIDYDEALLSIVESEGDHLITPIQSFENTRIIVDNGSRYELTLVNCVLTDEGQAEQPEVAYPAQDFEGRTDYVKVTVSAPEGAFPEGTTMTVADVEDEQTITDIEEKVSEGFVEVKCVHAVDIAFWNDGAEIEPLAPVSVVISVAEIEAQQDAVVVHVDDGGATEVVESQNEAPAGETEVTMEMPASDNAPAGAEQSSGEGQADGTEESQAFSADSFSVYAVVVTETIETKYIDAEGETWNISVGFTKEANIPVGATLDVRALADEESADYYDQAADALKGRETITMARFFDITIRNAEGAEVQPEAPVEVKVVLDETSGDAVKAVHFADEGMELIDADRDAKAVTFEAEGFSVYGIVYTVDFYYGVDGETYEYHIEGGSVQSLRELLPKLGVVAEDEAAGFVADIEAVTFSDETLVKPVAVTGDTTTGAIVDALGEEITYSGELSEADVEAIRARAFTAPDWALVSIRPFYTEEALTITLKNGEVVTVRVEDASEGYMTVNDKNLGYITRNDYGPFESLNAWQILNNQATSNYRFSAVPKKDCYFWKWTLTNDWSTWDANNYKSATIPKGAISSSQLYNERLVFTAVFLRATRGLDMLNDQRNMGNIDVNGNVSNQVHWYGDDWRGDDGETNRYDFKAVANSGYRFVRWDYYTKSQPDSNDADLANWICTKSFNTAVIEAGSFELDRGESWFLKPVFEEDQGGYFTVNDWSMGHLKYKTGTNPDPYYRPLKMGDPLQLNTNGDGIRYTIFAEANPGYVFCGWTVTDRSGNTQELPINTDDLKLNYAIEAEDGITRSLLNSNSTTGWVPLSLLDNGSIITAIFRPSNRFKLEVAYYADAYGGKYSSKYLSRDYKTTTTSTDGQVFQGIGTATAEGDRVFAHLVTPVPDTGYKFAFWVYNDNGVYKALSSINEGTPVPYDNVELNAYFTPEDKNLFIYQTEDQSKGMLTKNGSEFYMFVADSTDSNLVTVVPKGNNIFLGWFDQNGICVSREHTFQPTSINRSAVLTARFGEAKTASFNVSVNREDVGEVVKASDNSSYLGRQTTDVYGMLNETITARATNSDYVFAYWTVNGAIMSTDATIGPDNPPVEFFNDDDTLQAVFGKYVDKDVESHQDIQIDLTKKQEFDKWLESIKKGEKLIVDKTAHVYDYDNRIYQVNIGAKSTALNLGANIDIAFILDASNSMQFPSHMEKDGNVLVLTQDTLNATYPEGGLHYIISDPAGTSTIWRIFQESGVWYAVDDSLPDNHYSRFRIDENSVYSETGKDKPKPFAYPMYRAATTRRRKDDLNTNVNNTLAYMKQILDKVSNSGGEANSADIKVAYNTFASYTEHLPTEYHGDPFHCQEEFQSLRGDVHIDLGDTGGGTRQDLAMQEAKDYFLWENNASKYAILITDGAPVVGSKGATDKHSLETIRADIPVRAKELKDAGITLITIGLGTKNVSWGSEKLWEIASLYPRNPNKHLFFEAENGDQLEGILYEIVQTILENERISGEVVDVMDSAFYPVTASGERIQAGFYTQDGTKLNSESEWNILKNSNQPCYKWEVDGNGDWKITWENQMIGWDKNSTETKDRPWEGKIYLKAKEDFLGGNTISTNKNGSVTAEKHQNRNAGDNWQSYSVTSSIDLPVPHVNVDELSLTQNSTAWRVYLGTGVDPLDELKRLYEQIDVNEVVSQTVEGRHVTMTSAGDMLYEMLETAQDGRTPKDGMVPETFKLSAVALLTDDDWGTLIDVNTVEKAYSAYTHRNVGKIVYGLTKEVVQGEPGLETSPHDTAVEGQNVEKYTLTATYVPTAQSTPEDGWHTTPGEARGKVTNDMQSVNGHVIHVFVKGLKIKKMDATLQNRLIGAKFRLYRPALSGETENTLEIEGSNYVPATDEFTVGADGVAEIGAIKALKSGYYYLVETKAPDGYVAAAPMKVGLTLTDTFAEVPPNRVVPEKPSVKPYHWEQKANLVLEGSARRSDENWNATDQTPAFNSETSTVYYLIPNNSGVSLPNTGGAGTTLYYVAGTALLVLALVLLLRRRSEY